jgi:hypothetical protein
MLDDYRDEHDGISRSQLVRRVNARSRWNIPPRLRQRVVDLIEHVIEDPDANYGTKLQAAELSIKIDMADLAAEKLEMDLEPVGTEKLQHVVLLLPPNGTEAEGESDGTAER